MSTSGNGSALQWVHDNVAAFGGDPGDVTVSGSAPEQGRARYEFIDEFMQRQAARSVPETHFDRDGF